MMHQMFSIGERSGLQAGQFSTRTLLLRSHAVVIAAVCGFALSCWNTQGLPWNRHHLEGSICCSKTFIYLSAFIVPSKICKLPILYALIDVLFFLRCPDCNDVACLNISQQLSWFKKTVAFYSYKLHLSTTNGVVWQNTKSLLYL